LVEEWERVDELVSEVGLMRRRNGDIALIGPCGLVRLVVVAV
jgi:hypothetical protein